MRTNSILRLQLLAVALAVVAACGATGAAEPTGDDPTPPGEVADATTDPGDGGDTGDAEPSPGTTLNACEIVTADDVAAASDSDSVTPGELKAGPTVLSPGRTECTYEGDFGRVIVELTPEDGANLYDAAIGAYKGAELIDGLGDGAFWSDKNHRAFVWQGAVTLMFTIFTSEDVDPAGLVAELGSRALARI
jgi:hypothetical protein